MRPRASSTSAATWSAFPTTSTSARLPIAERVERTRELVAAGERVDLPGRAARRDHASPAPRSRSSASPTSSSPPAPATRSATRSSPAGSSAATPTIELQLAHLRLALRADLRRAAGRAPGPQRRRRDRRHPLRGRRRGARDARARSSASGLADEPPHETVGWSKCSSCGYFERCWPRAVERRSVGLLPWSRPRPRRRARAPRRRDDRPAARALRRRVPGRGRAPLGRADASGSATSGRAHPRQRPRARRGPPDRPRSRPRSPSTPTTSCSTSRGCRRSSTSWRRSTSGACRCSASSPASSAPPPPASARDGDREGWEAFLAEADGDLRRARRHPVRPLGDLRADQDRPLPRAATATATASPPASSDNLLDLLPITYDSVALPLSSYGLKAGRGARRLRAPARASTAATGRWPATSRRPRPTTRRSAPRSWTRSSPTTARIWRRRGR